MTPIEQMQSDIARAGAIVGSVEAALRAPVDTFELEDLAAALEHARELLRVAHAEVLRLPERVALRPELAA